LEGILGELGGNMYGKDTSYPVILRSIVPVSLPNHRDQPGHLDIHEVSFKELSSL
jgi:hypothetical protein